MEKNLIEFWRPSGLLEGFDNSEIENKASELFEEIYFDGRIEKFNLKAIAVPIAASSLMFIQKKELISDYILSDVLSEMTSEFFISELKKIHPVIFGAYLNFFEEFGEFDIEAEACAQVAELIAHKAILKSKNKKIS